MTELHSVVILRSLKITGTDWLRLQLFQNPPPKAECGSSLSWHYNTINYFIHETIPFGAVFAK